MTHIMKIDEMNNAGNSIENPIASQKECGDVDFNNKNTTPIRYLLLGDDDVHTKYEITVEGLIALYKELYGGNISFFEDYVNDVMKVFTMYMYNDAHRLTFLTKYFLLSKIFEKVNINEFIDMVGSGKFMKNMNPQTNAFIWWGDNEGFENSECEQWTNDMKVLVDFSSDINS